MDLTEEHPQVWVLVAVSCRDCNSMSVLVLEREPTDEDEKAVTDSAGGMFCIIVRRVKGQVGQPLEWDEYANE